MSNMCKFHIHDRVRVIDPGDPGFGRTGTIAERDPDYYHAYTVQFDNQDTSYYAAHHLVLAPGEHE